MPQLFRALALPLPLSLSAALHLHRRLLRCFRRDPSLIEELKSRGSSKKKAAKNGPAAKNKLGHKKLNCEAGIDS